MKYSFLTNLAATYYGECPYGTETYQDANCWDTSSDRTTSTSQSPTSALPSSTGNGSSSTNTGSNGSATTGQKDTNTTTTMVGETPLWFGLTPTGAFSAFAAIMLLVVGLVLFFVLLKRRLRKNKDEHPLS